jgi:predicted PurR-regulated permease PerM
MAESRMPDFLEDCLPTAAEIADEAPAPPPGAPTSLRVIAIILVFAALYFAKAFFVPVALALVGYLLLMPVVRSVARLGLHRVGAATLVLALAGAALGLASYELFAPARAWLASTPTAVTAAAKKWRAVSLPLAQFTSAADRIADETTGDKAHASTIVVQGPSLSSRVFGRTESLLAGALEVVLLLYALLVCGDLLLARVVHALPRCRDRQRVIAIAHTAERSISRYLFLTAAINVGEGVVVSLALASLGMPQPVLWGVLVACAEFVPYVGMISVLGLLTVAGLAYFDSLSHALLIPATFFAINFVQGNVVSPIVMSRRLTLNPLAIFLSLGLWWWLWGVAGAFLALPLLSAFKIVCDHVDGLAPIGALLGDPRARPVVRATPRPPTPIADGLAASTTTTVTLIAS